MPLPLPSLCGAPSVNSTNAHRQLGVSQSKAPSRGWKRGGKEKPGCFSVFRVVSLGSRQWLPLLRSYVTSWLAPPASGWLLWLPGCLAFLGPSSFFNTRWNWPEGDISYSSHNRLFPYYVDVVEKACRGGDCANREMGRDVWLGHPCANRSVSLSLSRLSNPLQWQEKRRTHSTSKHVSLVSARQTWTHSWVPSLGSLFFVLCFAVYTSAFTETWLCT